MELQQGANCAGPIKAHTDGKVKVGNRQTNRQLTREHNGSINVNVGPGKVVCARIVMNDLTWNSLALPSDKPLRLEAE